MPFVPDNQPVQKSGFVPDVIPQKSIGGFAGNVLKSGANLVGNTAGAILSPIETVKNLISVVKDPMVLINYYKDRYGKDLATTLYEDPVGVMADLSALVGGVGGIAKGVGAVGKAESIANAGSKLSKVSSMTDPLAMAGKAVSSPMSKLFKKVGPKITSAGEELVTKGLGNPAKQADITAKTGVKVGDFIDKYDLYDRTPETAKAAKNAILNRYDELATKSGSTVKVSDLIGEIDRQIEDLSGGTNAFSDTNMKSAAELARRKEQIITLTGGADIIPTAKLVEFRRVLDKDIPASEFGLNNRALGKRSGTKVTRDILKAKIDSTNPEIATLGKEYGVAKGVEDIFRKSQNRAGNRQLISLPKIGTAGVGQMMGGLPGALTGYAVGAVTTNPAFLKVASKGLKKVGKTISEAKMPKIPGVVKTGYKVAKAGRLINLPATSNSRPKLSSKQDGQSTKQDRSKQIIPTSKSNQSSLNVAQTSVVNPKLKINTSPFQKKSKVSKGSFY